MAPFKLFILKCHSFYVSNIFHSRRILQTQEKMMMILRANKKKQTLIISHITLSLFTQCVVSRKNNLIFFVSFMLNGISPTENWRKPESYTRRKKISSNFLPTPRLSYLSCVLSTCPDQALLKLIHYHLSPTRSTHMNIPFIIRIV